MVATKKTKIKMSHIQVIALGYFIMIMAGALLLMLPISSESGEGQSFTAALFTSTSASCVTGLVVCDTSLSYSFFGEVVIITLIQVGGLGFMTLSILFMRLLRRRVGLREKAIMMESLNLSNMNGLLGLVTTIIKGTLLFEGAGALFLSFRFIPLLGFKQGVWYSIFHSISAFCNAGFDLMGPVSGEYSSLMMFRGDVLVNVVIMSLIVIGGIGFLLWDNVLACRFNFRKFSLTTKLALSTTAVLIISGALLLMILERNTLKYIGMKDFILSSFFGSVTARTAGFNTTDIAALSPGGKLVMMMLMFIGGSPGSTAGGIKTTTFAVLLIHTFSQFKSRPGACVFQREIQLDSLRKAVTVTFTNLCLVILGTLIIFTSQTLPLEDVFLETFSAMGTVGMSTGITRELTKLSKYVVILLMYLGRVGSMSFALALMEKRGRPAITYPHEDITIG